MVVIRGLLQGLTAKSSPPYQIFRKLAISQSKRQVVHFLGMNLVDDSFSNNYFEMCHIW